MDIFVARQPILDRAQALFAYELLFRASADAAGAGGADGNHMASHVILSAMGDIGLDRLVGQRRAFVNVTRDILLGALPEVLPPDVAVIEILESIEPDRQVVAAVTRLRELGYLIALDDFEYHPRYHPLLELADVVKLDVLDGDLERVERVLPFLDRFDVALLAERVETHEVFRRCHDLGFDYFQGYFFARPQTVSGHGIPHDKITALRLLRVLNDAGATFGDIEKVISTDVSLSYKLLRYINSPLCGLRQPVRSIREALVLLGLDRLRKWASLVVFSHAGQGKPSELVRSAQLRARLCEQLAPAASVPAPTAFTVGLFSRLDALLDQPMKSAVAPLGLGDDITAALLAGRGPLGSLLRLAAAWERADWAAVEQARATLRIPPEALRSAALDAGEWVETLAVAS